MLSSSTFHPQSGHDIDEVPPRRLERRGAGTASKIDTRVQRITVLGGHGKNGSPDLVERVELAMGDVVSIVGPTGSGKTTLINDIELFADGNTPSGRRVLFDGAPAPAEYRDDPSRNPVALITQHTTFLSDMPVESFLTTHARVRGGEPDDIARLVSETVDFANELTGEPLSGEARMTELSGGQTRALLIADAAIICSTPIVLLDEVENAGIHRTRAVELLRRYPKIFVFVTHDPRIALLSDSRIVMQGGRIVDFLVTDEQEREFSVKVAHLDDAMAALRDHLRHGHRLAGTELDGVI
jgi:ABC-type lipoprotein export system ATPase subunit